MMIAKMSHAVVDYNGTIVVIGGGSADPNQFHADEIFSFRRITLSPIVILLGFVIVLYGIMKKSKE